MANFGKEGENRAGHREDQEMLRSRLPDLDDDHRAASNRVRVAVDAVLRGPAEQLLALAEDLATRFRSARYLLKFMVTPQATGDTGTRVPPAFGEENWDRAAERRLAAPAPGHHLHLR
jgi:hypothetical protein